MPEVEQNIKWYDVPIIGKYSTIDFSRTGIAIVFIMLCMSFLTLYIHHQVNETSDERRVFAVEYVNMLKKDVYDKEKRLILKAPELVIDRVIEFPISYDKMDFQGYIILDTHTGNKYIYLRNTFGITFTKYWTEAEFLANGGDPNHEFDDEAIARPENIEDAQ